MPVEFFGHPPLEPVTLQFGGGQQLANVVMQFPAQSVTLVFLNLQQAVGEFLGLEFYRFAREAVLHPDAGQRGNVEKQQTQRQVNGKAISPHTTDCGTGA
ncbi:hypothetical protein D3C84_510400 [compost metagenome]